ncbi:MAG: hypothetical protein M3Y07_12380 [Acidobacteriota bacterium]|nr:hypothetical protein [Acidobacteriota bacterium]
MEGLRLAIALLLTGYAFAGTEPRPKVLDYPVHVSIEELELGAEYLVHSFSNGKQSYFTPDYLVIEVAVYPAKGREIEINNGQFALRINRKKQTLGPQPPGFVAASLKYPDWTWHPGVTATAGIGDEGVTIGRQPRVNRFPGDPTEQQTRLPRVPGAAKPEPPEESRADVVVVEKALLEEPARFPASGFLYFPYSGKAEKIKALDLIYQGLAGEVVLTMLP